MRENMVLIMRDECGDEYEVDRFKIGSDLDEGYIELWKEKKISEAMDRYPEAMGFYFEDRRNWNSMINEMVYGW